MLSAIAIVLLMCGEQGEQIFFFSGDKGEGFTISIMDKEVPFQTKGAELGTTDSFDMADVGQRDIDVLGKSSAMDEEVSVGGNGVGGSDGSFNDKKHQGKADEGYDALSVPIGPYGNNGE